MTRLVTGRRTSGVLKRGSGAGLESTLPQPRPHRCKRGGGGGGAPVAPPAAKVQRRATCGERAGFANAVRAALLDVRLLRACVAQPREGGGGGGAGCRAESGGAPFCPRELGQEGRLHNALACSCTVAAGSGGGQLVEEALPRGRRWRGARRGRCAQGPGRECEGT